jgi:hypothetical protein
MTIWRRFTKADDAELVRLCAAGATPRQIGAALSHPRSSIIGRAKILGAAVTTQRCCVRPWSREDIELLHDAAERFGWTLDATANILGRSRSTIKAKARERHVSFGRLKGTKPITFRLPAKIAAELEKAAAGYSMSAAGLARALVQTTVGEDIVVAVIGHHPKDSPSRNGP